MNKIIITGNLAADPELREVGSDKIANLTMRVAVQRRAKNKNGERESDFFTVICWRQLAELCGKYLSKGRKVLVEGSLQTRSYDAQDGSKRYVTEIIAENVEFLSAKGEGGSAPQKSGDGYASVEDEDLPF